MSVENERCRMDMKEQECTVVSIHIDLVELYHPWCIMLISSISLATDDKALCYLLL